MSRLENYKNKKEAQRKRARRRRQRGERRYTENKLFLKARNQWRWPTRGRMKMRKKIEHLLEQEKDRERGIGCREL